MGDRGSYALACAYDMMGETVLDPARWPAVMDAICEAVGAAGAVLLQTDLRTVDVPRTDSFDEMVRRYFAGGWQTRDIRAERGVPLLMKGTRVFIDEDILTREELETSTFVNECTLPKGFKWAAGVGFSSGPAMWALCIHRTLRHDPFARSDARLLDTLCDRMTEVATLSTAIGRIALESAQNALDLIQKAAIAIDRFGMVLGVNRAAEATFDNGFRVRDRRVRVRDVHARSRLQILTDQLLVTPETEPMPTQPIIVRREGKGPLVIKVMPVHHAARNPFLGARALLVVSDIERKPQSDPALIAKVFDLTAAEARLAAAVAAGEPLERFAARHAVSLGTARNQLKAIFLKTGAHRQSELAALLARL
jgi:DNA-binding CsgD family transcriptional regulator